MAHFWTLFRCLLVTTLSCKATGLTKQLFVQQVSTAPKAVLSQFHVQPGSSAQTPMESMPIAAACAQPALTATKRELLFLQTVLRVTSVQKAQLHHSLVHVELTTIKQKYTIRADALHVLLESIVHIMVKNRCLPNTGVTRATTASLGHHAPSQQI